jgi:peptide/nickel transport system substrate-binding protein
VDERELRNDLLEALLTRRALLGGSLALGATLASLPGLGARSATAQDGTPRQGGSLVYGIENQLQPFTYNTAWMPEAAFDIYERLLDIDRDGKLVPYLAESFEVAEDGLTITLKIRQGKTWHNGDPVDAASIKALFDHWINPESTDFGETFYRNVTAVEAPDAATLILRLSAPDSNAYYGMAYIYSPIVHFATLQANPEEYGKSIAIGSGPFKFVSWEGDSVTVERVPDYFGAPDYIENKGPAYLDRITYTWLPDQASRTVNLESGTFDMVEKPAPQDVERLENNPDLVVVKMPQPALLYMGFNFKQQEKLGDRRVREAIYRAVDRQVIIDRVLFGLATPAFSPVVPHDPDYWTGADTLYPYDLERANALLDEAGWLRDGDVRKKDGVELALNLIILGISEQQTVAQVVQDQLKEIGVRIDIEVLDKGTHQQRQLEGQYDLNFFRYAYDSSIQVLKILYDSKTMPPNGANWAFYSNPRADEHFAAFRATTEPEARHQAIVGVQQVMLEDVAMVPIYSPLGIWAHHKWVQGFNPNPNAFYTLHNDIWVTEDSPRAGG